MTSTPFIKAFILLIGILILPVNLLAQDYIIERAWFEDETTTKSFSEIKKETFLPFESILNPGFHATPLWVRLRIASSEKVLSDHLVIRMRPPYFDKVQLFDPDFDKFGVTISGDRVTPTEENYFSSSLAFVINKSLGSSNKPRDIWLKINTVNSHLLQIQGFTFLEMAEVELKQNIFYAVYLTFMVLFIAWGTINWMLYREQLLKVFTIKQIIALIYALGAMGYYRTFWPDTELLTPDVAFNLMAVVMVAAVYWFDKILLKEFFPNRILLNLYWLGISLLPLHIVLQALGYTMLSMQINTKLLILLPLLSLITAISTLFNQSVDEVPLISRKWIILMYVMHIFLIAFTAMAFSGIINAPEWTLSGYLFYAILTGFFVMGLLLVRRHNIELRHQQLEVSLQSATKQTAIEKEIRQEKEDFLTMLTHELKTPLSVMRMVLGRKEINFKNIREAEEAILDMDMVINRCRETDRLDSNQLEVINNTFNLVQTLDQVLIKPKYSMRINFTNKSLLEINADLSSDHKLFVMIIQNLLDNALKYGNPKMPVELNLSTSILQGKKGFNMSISNYPGIADWPDKNKVFKKYYRHAKAHQFTGSGLGLYLVKGLAAKIQAQLSYEPTDTQIVFNLWIASIDKEDGKLF